MCEGIFNLKLYKEAKELEKVGSHTTFTDKET